MEGYWTTRGYANSRIANSRTGQVAHWTTRGYRLCGHKVTYAITYARKSINKWLNSNIQFHFIMQHFNMIQCRVLCHNLLKTTTTTGDVRELPSPRLVQAASWLVRELSSPLVDQSAICPVRELAIRELAYPGVVQLPYVLLLIFFFPRLISAVTDWMSATLPHMVWP